MFNIAEAFYFYAMAAVSGYFFLISAANMLGMKKNTSLPRIKSGPLVSVLIPARDEAEGIEACLDSLRNQDYDNYEILVIDDNSKDSTYEIAGKIATADRRVTVYKGKPLPEDWYGKPFALQQLSEHARGEIFLFTDADTIHASTSISWAVTNLEKTGADFISGYVGQTLKSFAERTTVPVIFLLTGFIIPMFLSRFFKVGYFSAAVGQYIVIKAGVFKAVGGFTRVKHKTSEDIYLARYIRVNGYRTAFLDISREVQCRMYDSYMAGIQGIGKNIYDFLGKHPPAIISIALLIFLFFCLPFPLLVLFFFVPSPWFSLLLAVNILFTLTWLTLFIGRRMAWYNTFAWPIMHGNLFFMVLWSFYRTVSGKGFIWKGRMVN